MEKCKRMIYKGIYSNDKALWLDKTICADKFVEGTTYEKYLLIKTNFDVTPGRTWGTQAKLAVKDEYTHDFAELSPGIFNRAWLEMQLVNNIRAF